MTLAQTFTAKAIDQALSVYGTGESLGLVDGVDAPEKMRCGQGWRQRATVTITVLGRQQWESWSRPQ